MILDYDPDQQFDKQTKPDPADKINRHIPGIEYHLSYGGSGMRFVYHSITFTFCSAYLNTLWYFLIQIMKSLWCSEKNTMDAIRDPNHNLALVPCKGSECEDWKDGWCLHKHEVQKRGW